MTHDQIRAELSELRDEEVSPARRDELTRHVAECDSCRAELRDWTRLSAAFLRPAAKPTDAETERFVRSVMARLPDVEPARPSFWESLRAVGWMTPALGFASAALVLSFLPDRSRASAAAEPMFIADGQDVALAAAVPGGAPGFGEAVGLGDDAR